jgi:peroxiredoxin
MIPADAVADCHYSGVFMLKTNSRTLRIGDTAPQFSLPTANRDIVQLSDYRGKRLVIVFIRGTW